MLHKECRIRVLGPCNSSTICADDDDLFLTTGQRTPELIMELCTATIAPISSSSPSAAIKRIQLNVPTGPWSGDYLVARRTPFAKRPPEWQIQRSGRAWCGQINFQNPVRSYAKLGRAFKFSTQQNPSPNTLLGDRPPTPHLDRFPGAARLPVKLCPLFGPSPKWPVWSAFAG